MSDILLIPMTETDARLILSGDRADDWSAGYPTPGDLEVADRIVSRQMPVAGDASPWGPWIVRSENLIVGEPASIANRMRLVTWRSATASRWRHAAAALPPLPCDSC